MKRLSKYIFILVAGILVAKGIFSFLDKRAVLEKKAAPKKITLSVAKPELPEMPPASFPKEVAPLPVNTQKKTPRPELTLNGIASSGPKAWAVINGRIVEVGDKVKQAEIVAIYPERVKLRFAGEEFTLCLK